MKVWRGITIGFWALFLAALLVLSALYFLVFQTVLNQAAMTARLERAGFYTAMRDTVLAPQLVSSMSEKAAPTPLLTKEMAASSVKAAFNDQKMSEIGAAVTPAVYAWLDKKSPDISFTVPIADELEAAQQHLSAQVETKLKALPECAYYYVDPAVVARAECLPQYTTVPAALQEVMAPVDVAVAEAPTELTPESFGLAKSQLGKGTNIPDYLSYLWSAAFITVPLAFLVIIYLIIRRKHAGLIVVGSIAVVLSLVLAGSAVFLGTIPPSGEALLRSVTTAFIPLLREKLNFLALIGAVSGVAAIVLGIIWRASGKRKSGSHYVSTDSGD